VGVLTVRARSLTASLALIASACGDTLVDHRAGDLLLPEACDPAACPDPGISGAVPACVAGACGYACQGGLLRCSGGCCPATKIAAGEAHTCAIAGAPSQGELYCWGANESRQVSRDVISDVYAVPLRVASDVTAVALGRAHTCAIVSGEVLCWGANGQGQAPAAAAITAPKALAAGASHTCAIDGSDVVRCWGAGMPATPAVGGAASAIASGASHACALVAGAVKCWGAGAAGQLGVDPPPVTTTDPVQSLTGIAAIAAGGDLTCAATAEPSAGGIDDALRCWGSGLGLIATPQLLPAIPMKDANQSVVRFDVDALSVGREHVCVKRNVPNESVQCLGTSNDFGQLGAAIGPEPDALVVDRTLDAKAFAAGANHTCAVTAGGGVVCWGLNGSGQLGNATVATPPVGTVVSVSGL
jgi:hypothetical protein